MKGILDGDIKVYKQYLKEEEENKLKKSKLQK